MKKMIFILAACLMLSACTAAQTGTDDSTPGSTPAESTQETTAAVDVTTASTEAQTVETDDMLTRFTVYTPNENLDGFVATEVEGYQLTVLEALIDAGVLNEDVQILSVAWTATHATVDMNGAFRDLVNTMGSTGERMLMGSVVNTFLSAYAVETVTITVEGEAWESGHVVYDFPMEFYE